MVKKYGGESGIESLLNVGKASQETSNNQEINGSLDQVINKQTKTPKPKKIKNPTSFQGCKNGWKRYSTTFRVEHLEKIKTLAFLQDRNFNEIIDEALEQYLKNKKIEKIR